jgi:hypothetical protein
LRARVNEVKHGFKLAEPTRSAVARGDAQHAIDRETGCAGECVEPGHSAAGQRTPPDVEGSAFGRGDCTTSQSLHLTLEQYVAAGQHTLRRTRIHMYQLDWDIVIDPLGAVQGRGCVSSDDAPTVRPQPRRGNTLPQGWLCLFRQVDVRQDGSVLRPQLVATQ